MLQALLFDFDGTLTDTYDLCVHSFELALAEVCKERTFTREQIISHFGYSEDGVFRAMLGEEFAQAGFDRYVEHYQAGLQTMSPEPFPHVRELLATARELGYRLACATGKSLATARLSLRYFRMEQYFETVTGGSPTEQAKTWTMRTALQDLGLPPEQCLYVGDAWSDITSARPLHLPVCAAAWAPTAILPELQAQHPELLFENIPDFIDFLKKANHPEP